VPAPAGNITIAVTNPTGGTCTSVGGEVTCLSVVVTPAGQFRMCNPAFPATDPQGC
jgi:type IV fimbrial biogenesis protein FimT